MTERNLLQVKLCFLPPNSRPRRSGISCNFPQRARDQGVIKDSGSGTPRPLPLPGPSVGLDLTHPSIMQSCIKACPFLPLSSPLPFLHPFLSSIRLFQFTHGALFYMTCSPTLSRHENGLRPMPVRGRSCFPLPEKGDGERSVVHKPEASAIPPLGSVLFISSQTRGWARVGVCSYPQISLSLVLSQMHALHTL